MATGVLGIIAPHPPIMVASVGGPDAARTADSAQAMAEAAQALARFDPQTIVVMSPHSPALGNAFLVDTAAHYEGGLERFGAPHPHLTYDGDTVFASALLSELARLGVPAVDRAETTRFASGVLDHGVVVPLSFLDPQGRWPLVSVSLSGLDMRSHRTLGHAIAEVASVLERRIAFVASGDLSHRLAPGAPAGYEPEAQRFDSIVVELVEKGELDALASIDPDLSDRAGECGLRSFVTLSGIVHEPRSRVLAYEAPWGVGYLTALVAEPATFERLSLGTPSSGTKHGAPGRDGHEIVALARDAIEAYVRRGEHIEPAALHDPALPGRAGVFVSLHERDALRGCIGTIVPTCPTLAEEVVRNAIEAAVSDPRFPPVAVDELEALDLKVDVLHPPEPCDPSDLDPVGYGVIVTAGGRQGLLLPDLEGVDTAEQQIAIASRKAGIAPGTPVACSRFRVDRYA